MELISDILRYVVSHRPCAAYRPSDETEQWTLAGIRLTRRSDATGAIEQEQGLQVEIGCTQTTWSQGLYRTTSYVNRTGIGIASGGRMTAGAGGLQPSVLCGRIRLWVCMYCAISTCAPSSSLQIRVVTLLPVQFSEADQLDQAFETAIGQADRGIVGAL